MEWGYFIFKNFFCDKDPILLTDRKTQSIGPRWWHSRSEHLFHMRMVWCSNLHNKVVKEMVTAPLRNARQQVRVSRVLGDDHYK